MSASGIRGIYKPNGSPYWWYRIGRHFRRSSKSSDINVAISLREKALQVQRESIAATAAIRRQIEVDAQWIQWIEDQKADGNSWLRRTHTRMRRKTKLRGWFDCISFDDLVDIARESDGECELTGIRFRCDTGRDPFSISIDRIDSSKGYTADNVRFVLLAVNLGMSHWGDAAFRQIARALVGRELLKSLQTCTHMDKSTVLNGK